MEDEFNGESAPESKKYALVKPVTVGVSSENHYAVRSGLEVNQMIVTGGYKVLSKELNHGTLVSPDIKDIEALMKENGERSSLSIKIGN